MRQTVNDILKSVFDLTDAEVEQNLTRNQIGKWDSLAHMELVVSLESALKITLSIEEIIELNSLEAVRLLMRNKGVSS